VLLVESTYGNRLHPTDDDTPQRLAQIVRDTVAHLQAAARELRAQVAAGSHPRAHLALPALLAGSYYLTVFLSCRAIRASPAFMVSVKPWRSESVQAFIRDQRMVEFADVLAARGKI
jgi:hypothetical protein